MLFLLAKISVIIIFFSYMLCSLPIAPFVYSLIQIVIYYNMFSEKVYIYQHGSWNSRNMGSFKAWTVPAEDVMIMHAVKVCGQEWKESCSTAAKTSRRTTLWKSWRLWSGDIIWIAGPTEESAPPTVGCWRQPEESSTMIISFSLHNSCSYKMCQVILTKPYRHRLSDLLSLST